MRIVVEHIALKMEDPARRIQNREAIARLVAPHTTERNLYCEFHIDETPRDLWMIDGIAPPLQERGRKALGARESPDPLLTGLLYLQ